MVPIGKFRRTRHRRIYRVGNTYVVLERDEDGVRQPVAAASLAEALLLRESLRAARRGPHQGYLSRSMWEDKSRDLGRW